MPCPSWRLVTKNVFALSCAKYPSHMCVRLVEVCPAPRTALVLLLDSPRCCSTVECWIIAGSSICCWSQSKENFVGVPTSLLPCRKLPPSIHGTRLLSAHPFRDYRCWRPVGAELKLNRHNGWCQRSDRIEKSVRPDLLQLWESVLR